MSDLNVGFKWMAQIIQEREDAGRVGYFFATEESIGYLAGNFVRDKDASIAALLVAEMASALKDRGLTIWQYLDELYAQFGCYRNLQHLVELPGKTGMQVMREVMLGLRRSPPASLGGHSRLGVLDRLAAAKSTREAYAHRQRRRHGDVRAVRRPAEPGDGPPVGNGAEAEVLHPAVRTRPFRRLSPLGSRASGPSPPWRWPRRSST